MFKCNPGPTSGNQIRPEISGRGANGGVSRKKSGLLAAKGSCDAGNLEETSVRYRASEVSTRFDFMSVNFPSVFLGFSNMNARQTPPT
jgi:hypothetical protein